VAEENIWRKRPVKWGNNSWVLHHDYVPAHTSLLVCQLLTSEKRQSPPTLPTHQSLLLLIFSYFQKMKLNLEERRFESIEDSFQISGRDEDADTK
jgi:hypothetical protein